MTETPLLKLPLLAAAQAQKHVTHNEALRLLDSITMLAIADRDLNVPPAAPTEAARYLVASGASGEWLGKDGSIAAWHDGAWVFLQPRDGWLAFIVDERRFTVYAANAWRDWPVDDRLPRLGINAEPDASNAFAVSAAGSLFSHAGASHRLKINKANPEGTASVLFQRDFLGRAEIGLSGDDRLRVKISADGALWQDALVLVPGGDIGLGIAEPSARLHVDGAVRVRSYALAEAPDPAAQGAGAIIYLSDEAGGAVLAFSDGANWRRGTDRAIAT
jgi:hypothetical protein